MTGKRNLNLVNKKVTGNWHQRSVCSILVLLMSEAASSLPLWLQVLEGLCPSLRADQGFSFP